MPPKVPKQQNFREFLQKLQTDIELFEKNLALRCHRATYSYICTYIMQGKTDQFWTFGNIPAVEGFSCALFPIFLFEVGGIFYCVIDGLLIHLKNIHFLFRRFKKRFATIRLMSRLICRQFWIAKININILTRLKSWA